MGYRIFKFDTGIDLYGQKHNDWAGMQCFGSTVGEVGCSLVCMAMCVDETPETLVDDGWGDTRWMMWEDVANDYGYSYDTSIDYDVDELYDALYTRKAPIIVRVREENNYGDMHFVVIEGFKGKLAYDPQGGYYGPKTEDMFIVYDPQGEDGEIKKLSDCDVIKIMGQVY